MFVNIHIEVILSQILQHVVLAPHFGQPKTPHQVEILLVHPKTLKPKSYFQESTIPTYGLSKCWKYALEAITKFLFIFPYIMINVYYSCQNCINRKLSTYVNTQTNKVSLVCLYLTSSLNQRWLSFLAIDMCCHLMNEIRSLENDVMDNTHSLAQHNDRLVYCYCFLHDLYMFL